VCSSQPIVLSEKEVTMLRISNTIHRLLLLVLIIAMLAACGEQGTAPPDIPATEEPNPDEPPTPEGELRPAEFDGTVVDGIIGGTPVLVGNGTIVNDAGQVLLIIVTGVSEPSIREYFNSARFNFEIRDSFDFPEDTKPEDEFPNLSVEELMQDTAAENLNIEFQVSEETAQEIPTAVVYLIVDPTVRQSQYNNYGTRDPSNDSASVTVRASAGKVTARLYRQCSYKTGTTVASGSQSSISNTGPGRFDLTVYGNNSGANTYRLTGAWNYDYSTSVASTTTTNVTC
jgi:hypothetical protein